MKAKQTRKKVRVMLVDDHSGLREALRKVINLQPLQGFMAGLC